jgi:Protein of unknown function (DUF2950)
MDIANRNGHRSHVNRVAGVAASAILMAGIVWFATPAAAQEAGQKTFPSPEEAISSLVAALQADDSTSLAAILGPDSNEVLSSGDPVEDKNGRDQFLEKYKRMHRLVKEPDGSTGLYVGAENWPMPIPLMNKSGAWFFSTAAGKKEIVYRRIGKNELAVIQVLRQLVPAQKEYFSQPHDGDSTKQFAQRFFSDPGKQNGLYWKVASGEPESPIGPLVARAEAEGYVHDPEMKQQPFQGYYYRVLNGQRVPGSKTTRSFIVGGKMTGGFAFVAFPAEYRSSGVMTFIVNRTGVVYEKDLGPKTAEIAKSVMFYSRDTTWRIAQ